MVAGDWVRNLCRGVAESQLGQLNVINDLIKDWLIIGGGGRLVKLLVKNGWFIVALGTCWLFGMEYK